LLYSRLLSLPVIRARLLDLLADKSAVGTIKLHSPRTSRFNRQGHIYYQTQVTLRNGETWHSVTGYADSLFPKPDVELTFRTCDLYAQHLSLLQGFPESELFWPESARDEAVTKSATLLKRYGARLVWEEPRPVPSPSSAIWNGDWPHFELPALDHPATADDVEQGRAIFSLAGEGSARVVPLVTRPLPALWLAPKDKPHSPHGSDGFVWQAEEVEKDGVTHRYYGFVGRNAFAKVPAEEVPIDAADARED
jgi:hypothetical protein